MLTRSKQTLKPSWNSHLSYMKLVMFQNYKFLYNRGSFAFATFSSSIFAGRQSWGPFSGVSREVMDYAIDPVDCSWEDALIDLVVDDAINY